MLLNIDQVIRAENGGMKEFIRLDLHIRDRMIKVNIRISVLMERVKFLIY